MTESKLYTLSPASKKILDEIDEPITLRLLRDQGAGREIPSGFNQRVEELLAEYKNAAHGKLKARDPRSPSNSRKSRTWRPEAGVTGYAGAPARAGREALLRPRGFQHGRQQAVDRFHRALEGGVPRVRLTKLIYSLAHPSKLVLGVLSSLPIEGGMPNPMDRQPPQAWYIMDAIRESYETKTIQPNATEIRATSRC